MSEEHGDDPTREPSEPQWTICWGDDAADCCPDCGGKGTILLPLSTVPCPTCGGIGYVTPAPGPEVLARVYHYDEHDQLTGVEEVLAPGRPPNADAAGAADAP